MGLAKNFFDIGKTAHPFGKAAGAAPYLQTDAIAEKISSMLDIFRPLYYNDDSIS